MFTQSTFFLKEKVLFKKHKINFGRTFFFEKLNLNSKDVGVRGQKQFSWSVTSDEICL